MIALLLGAAACVGTLLATVRVHRPAECAFVTMMIGWLVGELAVFHLGAQVIAVGVLAGTGAADTGAGIVGIGLFVVSIVGLSAVHLRAIASGEAFRRGLASPLGAATGFAVEPNPAASPPRGQARRPFHFDHRGIEVIRDLSYGDDPRRNRLDLYRAAGTTPSAGLPVVVYLHGGGWVIGNKSQQGKPLLLHLARRGYLAVTVNYRLAPRHRWPAQIVDVKRAIVWVREHIAEYGGDPSFLAVAGSSAGGHLAALAALTPGDASFQPGFEHADAAVDACVPIYAPFDFTDRSGVRGRGALRRFLEPALMTTKLGDDVDGWRAASPLWRVNPAAPPMFVIQGAIDPLVPREEAREFVTDLGACATEPLVYVEVPGAQHAFEVFNSVRCRFAIDAIGSFLDAVRWRTTATPPTTCREPGCETADQ